MDNFQALAFVFDNILALQQRGVYEEALIQAYRSTSTNYAGWKLSMLEGMFRRADRKRLRELAPLPAGERFTLYRGVAGVVPHRKTAGLSWTRSVPQAAWFAMRFAPGVTDPAVYETEVDAGDVFCSLGDGVWDDFILRSRRYRRLRLSRAELLDFHRHEQAANVAVA